jgi:alpha,alpha-trehalase
MMRDRSFEAVIADMDGVLTGTATLHERAWKQMFDPFLATREDPSPFSSADYRAHVDGKPRYDGVADFLASRGIDLPRGRPSDGPERQTVYGLGNRKNELFDALLQREGVQVFKDAIPALERWRREGLQLAVVSASRNCRRVLEAADLVRRVDVIVDGQLALDRGLQGKADIMLEAARRLDVLPSDAVVVENPTAGVRAARQGGFGLVVGIARDGHAHELAAAGADLVVDSLARVHPVTRG